MKYVYTDRWFINRVVLIGDAQYLEDSLVQFSTKRTHKIRILRRINRVADFLSFHQWKPFFCFWGKHHYLSETAAKAVDSVIRLGWKYA